MRRVQYRRLMAILSLVCVVELAHANTRFAVASATAIAVQPRDPPVTEGYRISQEGPVTDTSRARRDPPPSRYNCETRGDAIETIANCDGMKDRGGSGLWKILLAIAVAIMIGAILKKTVFSSGNQSLSERTLLLEGPQLPVTYPDGSLAVRGFARDGWPIVVDFQPEPGTVTELQVTIDRRTQKFVLDPDGSGGRQLAHLVMPATGRARTPKPATYLISSLPIASFDVDQPQGAAQPAPLQVYGVGGGPRAVGSVAIENVRFKRPTQAPQGAQFSYFAKSQFQRARAQVQQLHRSGGTIQLRPVFNSIQSNLFVGPQSGSWSGSDAASATPSRGLHRLQVTAWFTTDDRSWVAALAPDLVAQ